MIDANSDFFSRVELQKLQFRLEAYIGSPNQVQYVIKERNEALFASVELFLLGKKSIEEYEHTRATTTSHAVRSIPKTWWDHLKLHPRVPRWFVERFPAAYEEIVVVTTHTTVHEHHVTRVCPHIDIPQNDRRHVEFCLPSPPNLRARKG